jgi:hypothetical protein
VTLDLVVVAPDKDIEQACLGLFGRHRSLRIRPIRSEVLVHPLRDPGCYRTGHELLIPMSREARHALVIFDRAWDGAPGESSERIATRVEERLRPVWADRARCVVIDPEVDVWLWSDSPHVADVLGWFRRRRQLRRHLEEAGVWESGAAKPSDPKRAIDLALRKAGVVPSSAIFRRVAERVSLERCTDPSFRKLTGILRSWFPAP